MKWGEILVLPNIITCINLLFGFFAISAILEGQLKTASLFILAAVLVDASDGIVARKLSKASSFGKELDSLADLVSFGVAPAFLVYNAFLLDLGNLGLALSSIHLLAGAFRLARFNVEYSPKGFLGLPVPACGGLYAGLVYPEIILGKGVILLILASLSILMMSSVPYPKIGSSNLSRVKNNALIFALTVSSLIVLVQKELLFLPFMVYVFFGLALSFQQEV
ncbi:MAG: CDP-diacylglycerol--serine O-phosphatidyltransferase [Candidatus Altiarchaeota archaeon]